MIEEIINDDFDENTSSVINLKEHIETTVSEVEQFLEVIYELKKESFEIVIERYKHLLDKKMETGPPNYSPERDNLDYSKYAFLFQYPKLIELIEQSIFYHMRIDENKEKLNSDGSIELLFRDDFRSHFTQIYLLGLTLSLLFPREETLEICKTHNIRKWEKPPYRPEEIDDLEEFEGLGNLNRKILTHRRHGLMGEGRYILKIERCLYGEVVQDFEDLEIANSLECYIDHILPTMKNKNFVLTRTKTIMKGDSFCDICYHDKRRVDEVKHPSEEFWENFKID